VHPYTIIKLDSVDSTNKWAKEAFAAKKILRNTVILAETQTDGRGQLQTKWHDQKGCNLLFTLVVEPKRLPVNQFFFLNQAVAIALLKAMPAHPEAYIKWPNDVLIKTKKVAGILIETVIGDHAIKRAYIGVGLNVNQKSFPPALRATSLQIEHNTVFDLEEILFYVLSNIHSNLDVLLQPRLHNTYLRHLWAYHKTQEFAHKGNRFTGFVETVLPTGELVVVNMKTHQSEKYQFKEIEWIFPSE
jgi:BirA family biotin operon repressor/biotin-[acetyl-CoA-carboxylase] ligase